MTQASILRALIVASVCIVFTVTSLGQSVVSRVALPGFTPVNAKMMVNQQTNLIYMLGNMTDGESALAVLDGSNNRVSITRLGGAYLTGDPYTASPAEFDPTDNKIYVLQGGTLIVIHLDSYSVTIAELGTGGDATTSTFTLDSTTNRLYVWAGSGIFEFDASSLNFFSATDIGTSFEYYGRSRDGSPLNSMVVNPINQKIYLCDTLEHGVRILGINPVQSLSFFQSTAGSIWWSIDVNPVTNRIYMPVEHGLMVMSGIDNSISTLLPQGFLPGGAIAINTATNRIYLPGSTDIGGATLVVDGNNNTVLQTINSDALAIIARRERTYMGVNSFTNRLFFYYQDNGGNYEVVTVDPSRTEITAPPGGGAVTLQSDAATITFDNVTSGGTVSVSPISNPTAGEISGGFAVSEIGGFEVQASEGLAFSGSVVIGFKVPFLDTDNNGIDDNNSASFADLRIMHREQTGLDVGGNPIFELVDRTILPPDSPAPDLQSRTIYARVTSFSPFYLSRRGSHIRTLFDQNKAHKRGSTVPIKLQMFNSNNDNVSSSSTALVVRDLRLTNGNTSAPVIDSGNANPDSTFRYDPTLGGPGGGYIFNLSTRGLASGQYALSFHSGSDRSFFYTVKFEVK